MSDKLKKCPLCGSDAVLQVIKPHQHEFIDVIVEGGVIAECTGCGCGMIKDTVEEVVELWNSRVSGWIPCSERLPEPGLINPNTMDYQQYMCLVEFNEIQDARSLMLNKHGDWINGGVNMTDYVIAWQPLPEPYRG